MTTKTLDFSGRDSTLTRWRILYDLGCGCRQAEWMTAAEIAMAGGRRTGDAVTLKHPGRSAMCAECETLQPITTMTCTGKREFRVS